jgi:hypothetical protein
MTVADFYNATHFHETLWTGSNGSKRALSSCFLGVLLSSGWSLLVSWIQWLSVEHCSFGLGVYSEHFMSSRLSRGFFVVENSTTGIRAYLLHDHWNMVSIDSLSRF